MWNMNGVTLDRLYDSGSFVLYRATHTETNEIRLLKRQKHVHPLRADGSLLRRELETGGSLPLAQRMFPLELIAFEQETALLLRDEGEVPLSSLLSAGPVAIHHFLPLAVSMSEAVHQLHRLNWAHLRLSLYSFFVESEGKSVKISDFYAAEPFSSIENNKPHFESGEELHSFVYVSPEQTGRMNRKVNYRSDLYSLGVLFYEMLTGVPPFHSEDVNELAHCHVAHQPIPPAQRSPLIPKTLSDLIMKCLAKHPEQRYPSAFALQLDLERCLSELELHGRIPDFEVGASGGSDQFYVSETIYGRSEELAALRHAYTSASQGGLEFVLVKGMSGVGKSYLIHEFQKSLQRQPGLFITGKFDQFREDLPYQAIIQAGKQQIQYLLTLNENDFQIWKERILEAVSPNGQVLIDMVPELELILGKQPPLAKLPPAEMHNRFILTLEKYLSVFISKERPMIMFLDDLQWADPGSIQLIQDMAQRAIEKYVLFIGAYRDQELGESHPVRLMTDKLARNANLHLIQLELEPLQPTHIETMVRDTLRPVRQPIEDLSAQIMSKTKGNPFFTKQFFRSLYDQKLLYFNYDSGFWEWEAGQIQELHITDNVVDFMINKIKRLPEPLQHVLMHAACIGNQFNVELLSLVTEQSSDEVMGLLNQASKDGLVLAVPMPNQEHDPVYKFMHDRVLQAVYSLVDKEHKKQMHIRIGKLYQQIWTSEQQEDRVFEIANQLNQGLELLSSCQEKEQLAQLNLSACRKAKRSAAYDTALKYANYGLHMLNKPISWNDQYPLTFSLSLELAELEYLCGHFGEAKRTFETVVSRARTNVEKAEAYNSMMVLYTNMGEHMQALEMGLEGLRLLGVPILGTPNRAAILWEMLKTRWNMGSKHPEDLLDAPVMTDPVHISVMRLMVNLIPPAYFLNSDLYIYLMLKMFNYSLIHGQSEGSAFAYSTYSVILSSIFGRLKAGWDYGLLGLKLSDAFDNLAIKCKVYFGYGAFTSNLKDHIDQNVAYLRKAYRFGTESGDFVYAGYSIAFSFFLRLYKGDHLSEIFKESEEYRLFINKAQDQDTISIYTVLQRFMLFLKESPPLSTHPEEEALIQPFMNEEEQLQLQGFGNKAVIHTYYVHQVLAFYMFDRLEEAKAVSEAIEDNLKSVFGLLFVNLHYFNRALVYAALYPFASPADRNKYRTAIRQSIRFLEKWARHSPDNFLHLKLLLEAEWCRIHGEGAAAMEKYEQSIHYAGKNRFLNYEALANECAAKFYIAAGKLKIARSYLLEARALYAKWGAVRKVADLERKHPYLVSRAQAGEPTIDVSTMVKASQAISGGEAFHHMLDSIMTILLENAGADKGLLMLARDNKLFVEAEKMLRQPLNAMHALPLEECDSAAVQVLQFAARTERALCLDDEGELHTFSKDPYIQLRKPKSVLCLPIINLGKLAGILYLENQSASGVFHEERWGTLKLLASEIAMWIENTKLYAHLEYKDYKLQLLEEQEKNVRLRLDEKERWVQSAEATMLNIRKAQHELINNVQTVHALLMMNKYDMAKDYISVWCKEIVQQSVVNSVKFPVLGVVLSNVSLHCISGKIDLQVGGELDCPFDGLTVPISYFSSIVHNLLKNAIEAIPPDDPLRTLKLTIMIEDGFYKLTVFNTGSYIAEEQRSRIFDKGFSTKSGSANSGLGLHIAQNYLQHYGGSIECHSEEGVGTTFSVYFPRKAEPAYPLTPAIGQVVEG
ncbi:AAA family ATPase [Paenibacillus filicis]|uniref:histidine kinase n=1 Tax=Paenibacillus gyeongsangnamensis TaxID=3388067 RepID=A0ABT4QGQ6_9BACL|nr:AAA family ATPase [Paenibacillus filicis]MCZ8515916.1 AAA family ATPase [Paenibacillus filicis]